MPAAAGRCRCRGRGPAAVPGRGGRSPGRCPLAEQALGRERGFGVPVWLPPSSPRWKDGSGPNRLPRALLGSGKWPGWSGPPADAIAAARPPEPGRDGAWLLWGTGRGDPGPPPPLPSRTLRVPSAQAAPPPRGEPHNAPSGCLSSPGQEPRRCHLKAKAWADPGAWQRDVSPPWAAVGQQVLRWVPGSLPCTAMQGCQCQECSSLHGQPALVPSTPLSARGAAGPNHGGRSVPAWLG